MTNDRGHQLDYRMVEEAIIAPKRCPDYIGIFRCFVDLLSLHHTRTNTLSFDSSNYFGSRTGSTILATTRVIAWIILIGLIVISLVPAPLRPGTGVSHNLEHFSSFLLAGIIWCLAYADRLVLWLGTMPVFAGSVELLQIFVPGRHARLSDFAVDALGGCVGILFTFLMAGPYRALVSPSVRGLSKGDHEQETNGAAGPFAGLYLARRDGPKSRLAPQFSDSSATLVAPRGNDHRCVAAPDGWRPETDRATRLIQRSRLGDGADQAAW